MAASAAALGGKEGSGMANAVASDAEERAKRTKGGAPRAELPQVKDLQVRLSVCCWWVHARVHGWTRVGVCMRRTPSVLSD